MVKCILNKKLWIKYISFFVVLIYIIFLYMDAMSKDLGNRASIYLKYLTIILCFIISLLIGADGYNKRDSFLVQLARFFTIIADYFLVLFDNYRLGILSFCAVQMLYIIRHTLMEKYKYRNFIFMTIVLAAAFFIVFAMHIEIDRQLLIISTVYASLLITSLYTAIAAVNRGRYPKAGAWIIAIGIFLFFMCDLNVGLFNIINKYSSTRIYSLQRSFFTGFLIWVFYLPSQLMLALSSFDVKYLKKVFINKG